MNLLALQREFRCWLREESPDMASRLGDGQRAGLGVYLNNYRSQLLACLASSYPVLHRWMGETLFDATAAAHIEAMPPCAWSLDAYAEGLPSTLEREHGSRPELADLARLELALSLAFVGPDSPGFDAGDAQGIDWDRAVIHLVPTFAWVAVTTNVAGIWSAISEGRETPAVASVPHGARIMVWRRSYAPLFRQVSAEEVAVLEQVRGGTTFGSICDALVRDLGEASGTATAASMLGSWMAEGLIHRVD